MSRTLVLLAALLFGAGGCDRAAPASGGAKPLKIVVSADTAGWITPCGCTSNQSGGLLRRGTYLAQLAAQNDVIYLDAGGAPAGTSEYQRLKFEAMLRGEMQMKIAVHNIGASEAALGAEYLRDIAARPGGVKLISANATDAQGKMVATPSIVLTIGAKSVRVVGLLSTRYASDSVHVADPRVALANVLRDHTKTDLSIVLAYMPDDELHQFAASSPEVDAVIGGPTGQAIAPIRVGATLLAAATNKGKFLVEMDWNSQQPLSGRIVELNGSFADDAAQQANVQTYLKDLAARDFTPEQTQLVAPLPPGSPADYRFAGSASCATCHAPEQTIFDHSKHAHAFTTLRDKGFHVDPACMQCHTTGYGMPGGFETLNKTPDRIDVGCENCHGPSAAHVAKPKLRTPFAAVDQCVRCHDHENSPTFNYATYWERIRHGRGASPASTQSKGAR